MKKDKALLFLPYLAPYRINALNEIGKYYDLTVVFLLENTISIKYDQKVLRSMLKVDYIVLTSGFTIKSRQIRFGILKLIKRHKPKVIFSNEYGLTSLLVSLFKYMKLFNYKHISTTSDNRIMAASTHLVRRIARYFVLKSCEGLIVYNQETKDWYQDHYRNLKVRICPNIQNPDDLLKNTERYEALAKSYVEQYGLQGKKVYLFIGRLHPMKALDKLIANFKKVREPNEILLLVGDGPLKEELKKQIQDLNLGNDVLLPGKFEGNKLFAWYKVADLFILASNHEPFGAVINESLILGTPVLCSSVAGATYFIEEGMNGLIFDPHDSADFIEKFRLARNIFKDFNSAGANLMKIGFEESLEVYQSLYQEIKR
ncbi:glycosyltransferase [uncultured Sunxiuqinia sp.]|uniref:glycosyltransferase n=1 Tax=uncultured Sunxiuqinia sp. TaxID=1573825 RepID=UPI002621BEBB|nr:glycosyltransferase [uncultured Sunxiuqinia sp.]